MTYLRGLFCHNWDNNTDHLRTGGTYVISSSLHFQRSDYGIKHLAGHQFVIGRVVTGMCSPSPQTINVRQTLLGFGNGLNTATVPSWQAECSRPRNRGLHICIEASMIAIGTVTAYWIVSRPTTGSSIQHSIITTAYPGFRPLVR